MLYQLAEIISASKTLRGTLGLWVLVVDAALCDASAMSDGSPMRSGFLAERAIMKDGSATRRACGDADELVAAAVDEIEGDVTDYDMCIDLIQMIQDVFDHTVFQ